MTPALLALVFAVAALSPAANAASARIVVQHAPLAGFVYYEGQAVWERMRQGDRLSLIRDPGNSYDPNAIRLEWQGHMLGFVPRKDNGDIARQMDHGAKPDARITELSRHANGRHRISYEIFVPLK